MTYWQWLLVVTLALTASYMAAIIVSSLVERVLYKPGPKPATPLDRFYNATLLLSEAYFAYATRTLKKSDVVEADCLTVNALCRGRVLADCLIRFNRGECDSVEEFAELVLLTVSIWDREDQKTQSRIIRSRERTLRFLKSNLLFATEDLQIDSRLRNVKSNPTR